MIATEGALIRTSFKDGHEGNRARNVAKLLYMHMLGEGADISIVSRCVCRDDECHRRCWWGVFKGSNCLKAAALVFPHHRREAFPTVCVWRRFPRFACASIHVFDH